MGIEKCEWKADRKNDERKKKKQNSRRFAINSERKHFKFILKNQNGGKPG